MLLCSTYNTHHHVVRCIPFVMINAMCHVERKAFCVVLFRLYVQISVYIAKHVRFMHISDLCSDILSVHAHFGIFACFCFNIHAYLSIDLSIYLSIRPSVYLYTYTHTYIHTYVRTYIHTYIQILVAYSYVCVESHAWPLRQLHLLLYICISTCTCAFWVFIIVRMLLSVLIFAFIYVYTYIHIDLYIHIHTSTLEFVHTNLHTGL